MQSMMRIPYRGKDITILVDKESVGFSFEWEGKHYGNKTKVSRKRNELVGAVAVLIINAIESIEFHENKNGGVPQGTEGDRPQD